MTDTKKASLTEPDETQVVQKAKDFWTRFSKPIIYAGSAVILLAGGWLAYTNFIVAPKAKKANDAISWAQAYYAKDSLDLALNGEGSNAGFLKIIKNYSGTDAANLAHYYAGSIYLRKEDFANAIKHLKDFSTGATQVQSAAWKMLGDAYMSTGKQAEGVQYYVKAGKLNEKDEFTSSENLFLAAMAYESMGKLKEASEMLQIIKQKYPRTDKGFNVDKYLARVGVWKNE
ncbi:MAG TPA: tetratricopeptide repeat protein [Lacibacter sp.]|nr:tetratricopeptide repeat protein [Lacibacter sp.]HMO88980.1 tetratricopeptide repeat protein [Lacibacter sp.]